jgi:hypothetical protein
VLSTKEVPAKTKVLYIALVPAKNLLNLKISYHLKGTLEKLASGADEDLKAAAQKKLDEAK